MLQVFNITIRSQQLANLNPSQVIELAFMSAILEQNVHANSALHSSRYETIRLFLLEIAKVVPIESALYAITSSAQSAKSPDDVVVERCCKVLMDSRIQPPLSFLMYVNAGTAIMALKSIGDQDDHTIDNIAIVHEIAFMRAQNLASVLKNVETIGSTLHLENKPNLKMSKYLSNLLKDSRPPPMLTSDSYDYRSHAVYFIRLMIYKAVERQDITEYAVSPLNSMNDLYTTCIVKPPIDVLSESRAEVQGLHQLSNQLHHKDENSPSSKLPSTQSYNKYMLEVLKKVKSEMLQPCIQIMCSFLEQQVTVPLTEAKPLSMWKLMRIGKLFKMETDNVPQCQFITMHRQFKEIMSHGSCKAECGYVAKLKLLLTSFESETTMDIEDYDCYWSEYQLSKFLSDKKLLDSNVSEIATNYKCIFEGTTLANVPRTHQYLLATWMKASSMIHKLRTELSKCTATGIIGLVNSGKSLLLNKLFGIKVR